MLHRISAGALVEQEGRILLVRHQRPKKYDFWVAPGGGVQGSEALASAAEREVKEETGLAVQAERLVYVEEFYSPECRYCKFWFAARVIGGSLLGQGGPEAKAEHIVQVAWHSQDDLHNLQVFPEALRTRYWRDRAAGFPNLQYLGLREMAFW